MNGIGFEPRASKTLERCSSECCYSHTEVNPIGFVMFNHLTIIWPSDHEALTYERERDREVEGGDKHTEKEKVLSCDFSVDAFCIH